MKFYIYEHWRPGKPKSLEHRKKQSIARLALFEKRRADKVQ